MTLIVQLPPAGTLDPQLLVSAKSPGSLPLMPMLLMLTGGIRVFVDQRDRNQRAGGPDLLVAEIHSDGRELYNRARTREGNGLRTALGIVSDRESAICGSSARRCESN